MRGVERGKSERIGNIAIKWVAAGRLHGFVEEFPELIQALGRRVCCYPRETPETPVGNLRDLCRIIDSQES